MALTPLFVAALDWPTLPQQLVNGLQLGAIYALLALGYTMVYGVLRLINFAHGEVYMLGAYTALLVSYRLGFEPGATNAPEGSVASLVTMLLASMAVCALVGVAIERFAYRPMRRHSRIATLITAIGVSLLLQYGGALFLPSSPPKSISEKVNPYRGAIEATLVPASQEARDKIARFEPLYLESKKEFEAYMSTSSVNRFNLPPEGLALRKRMQDAEKEYLDAQRQAESSEVKLKVQKGQLIIFGMTVLLMAILTYVVLFTKLGRAMRAVSHDFDSASLMGVNVNTVITFTFILGSALAGAGAMMTATFLGTPLTTFYGLIPGVKAFVAAVLGGIGNIPGAVLGGLLMGVAENLVVWADYSHYRDAIAFVILIVVLLFRPGGLLGSSKIEKV
ncbi:MAG TPA: branched-chain amino acid ABC transporter permease [Fimbriimonas sp.]